MTSASPNQFSIDERRKLFRLFMDIDCWGNDYYLCGRLNEIQSHFMNDLGNLLVFFRQSSLYVSFKRHQTSIQVFGHTKLDSDFIFYDIYFDLSIVDITISFWIYQVGFRFHLLWYIFWLFYCGYHNKFLDIPSWIQISSFMIYILTVLLWGSQYVHKSHFIQTLCYSSVTNICFSFVHFLFLRDVDLNYQFWYIAVFEINYG